MYRDYTKRLLDLTFATITIVIASPVAAVVAIAIKTESPGPVIFRQKRYGKDQKVFTIYKFRTMYIEAPSDHPTNDLSNPKAYITKSGRIMRKLSIDELPQLINVLKGDMSIVGPRPVILKETNLIAEREKYGANACKPGITGWAQVNGRDELNAKQKAKMDGVYTEQLGFSMDLKCTVLSFWTVASRNGHRESSRSRYSRQTSKVEEETGV